MYHPEIGDLILVERDDYDKFFTPKMGITYERVGMVDRSNEESFHVVWVGLTHRQAQGWFKHEDVQHWFRKKRWILQKVKKIS